MGVKIAQTAETVTGLEDLVKTAKAGKMGICITKGEWCVPDAIEQCYAAIGKPRRISISSFRMNHHYVRRIINLAGKVRFLIDTGLKSLDSAEVDRIAGLAGIENVRWACNHAKVCLLDYEGMDSIGYFTSANFNFNQKIETAYMLRGGLFVEETRRYIDYMFLRQKPGLKDSRKIVRQIQEGFPERQNRKKEKS